jgi:hypothetical protein
MDAYATINKAIDRKENIIITSVSIKLSKQAATAPPIALYYNLFQKTT